jgi:adenosylcobinamide kinase / adenosylcobinamide-phosphate guanylyltransferase
MLLITGGAYAGKRTVAREVIRTENPARQSVWLSAYDQAALSDWPTRWTEGGVLVTEGWEQWLRETLSAANLAHSADSGDSMGLQAPLTERRNKCDNDSNKEIRRDSDGFRKHFREQLQLLRAEERRRLTRYPGTEQHLLICIMLEMGQGIVPLSGEDRQWRDLNGWLLQDGARLADEVRYVWHGLSRVLKP